MVILGISAYYHDSAAALVQDGVIVAAAQEERFTRRKHDPSFPHQAVAFCLQRAGISLSQVDHMVFYDKPFLKFERLLETYLSFAPRGFSSFRLAMFAWIKEKLFQKKLLIDQLSRLDPHCPVAQRLLFSEHHLSHAASAFYPSPFQEAAILTMDGVGEWATTSFGIGRGNQLEILKEIYFPHSLGLLYSAFTYFLGFKVNSGEYKVMGLAPYGQPRFAQRIFDHLLDVKEDGSFFLDQKYFNYCTGLTMTSEHFHRLFEGSPRQPEDSLTQYHMDLAASVQVAVEEVILRMARNIAKESGQQNLCLAGGVALNCVANGKLLREGIFRNIWIQPAAGDAGGALGAALLAYYTLSNQPRVGDGVRDAMAGSYLGPDYSQAEIEKRLTAVGGRFRVVDDKEMIHTCAQWLADGLALGWFQGRMEFGPRALGSRSILGDARSPTMQSVLNLKVKFRESFRPFAPSILRERLSQWFELDEDSPYMLLVAGVQPQRRIPMTLAEEHLFGIEKLNILRSQIPAVTHVDYSARVQTVHRESHPRYHALLTRFEELTGCPVIVNTSFNVRGEPIVCTPEDAFRCFMGTDLDVLAVGNCLLEKREQDKSLSLDYKQGFELD